MPMTCPDRIVLTDTERGDLDRLVRAGRTEQRLVVRARIVLLRGWVAERADRGVAGHLPGHRQDVAAPLVRRTARVLVG